MAAAAAIALATVAAGILFPRGPELLLAERIAFALRVDLFVVLWLFLAVANIARRRFFSPEDIGGSGGASASEPVRVGSAVLQNTLEQSVLAIVVHLGVAATLPRPTVLVAALAVLFGVGRASFWLGYARGAAARAFGFALTFYPTAFALLATVGLNVVSWLQ